MIKKIILHNFEPYAHQEIELSPFLNTIQGESDKGKSSFRRATNAVINNNFGIESGSYWIQKETKSGTKTLSDDSYVEFVLDDGTSIKRLRNGKVNQYILNGDEENPLEGFGQGVPDNIKDTLNFGELNIKNQEDPSFLFFDTPGNIGKLINKIANLEIMDRSLKEAKSRVKKTNTDIKYKEETVAELEEEVKKYEYLEEFETLLKEGEELYKEYKELKDKTDELGELIAEYKEINVPDSPIIECSDEINDLYNEFTLLSEQKDNLYELKELIDDYKSNTIEIERLSGIVGFSSEVTEIFHKFEDIEDRKKELDDLFYYIHSYKTLQKESIDIPEGTLEEIEALYDVFKSIVDSKDELDELQDLIYEVKDLQDDIVQLDAIIADCKSKFPDVCPTCNQPWTMEH